jgi:hypothetical protein
MKIFKKFTKAFSYELVLLYASSILATFYTYYYLILTKYSLEIPDALARLNIARRLVDNITPGFAQLGGVWLPLPQLFYFPFVQLDFMYKNGFAAAFINGIIFIIGSYFTFKIVELLTSNRQAAFVSGIAYVTASNLLFYQSTAMSETTLIVFLLGTTYYLIKWAVTSSIQSLFLAACFLILVTLTRYEGYAVLVIACLCVFVISLIKKRSIKATEGIVILFTTLASFGFMIWSIYLTLIFKDPLYWLKVYTNNVSILSSEDLINSGNAASPTIDLLSWHNILNALSVLFYSVIDMNGWILCILGFFGILVGIYVFIKEKKYEYICLLIMLGPILFLLANIIKDSSTMVVPILDVNGIFNRDFYLQSEFNSRYGLQALPIFVIFTGVLASKLRIFKFALVALLIMQFVSVYTDIHLLLPVQKRPPELFTKYGSSIKWLNENYDDGKILASVLANDAIMFHMRFPYRTYIFEGNGKYWLESLDDPTRYAKWVIFKNLPKTDKIKSFTDRVGYHLQDEPILINNYDLVYEGELLIYKIKDKPKFEIP